MKVFYEAVKHDFFIEQEKAEDTFCDLYLKLKPI
jgi:hypothetical protein